MATRKGSNPDQYLQKIGNTYYARVRVPRTLEARVGQTHLRRSLQTGQRAEANRLKHAVVGQMKSELERLRAKPATPGAPAMTFAEARTFRDELSALQAKGEWEHVEVLTDAAQAQADRVEALLGHEIAARWYRTATTTAENLKELLDRWLDGRDFRQSTNMGHRKALNEVLAFLGDEGAHPADVTHEKALAYIDNELMKRGLAANTIRDRLVSLGGFWTWMGTRNLVSRSSNPWKGHNVSKKQHAGSRPAKRRGGFTDDELLKLLEGNDRVRAWPTYAYLPDLAVLGMFTGGRIESLASLTVARVETHDGGFVLRMENDKTDAGTRPVGVVHLAPLAVLQRRMKGKTGAALLFPELRPGGADDKLSASASKAFGRYRRTCGVPDGTDFHSFRRNVTAILEGAGLMQAEIARFVGHKVGTLAADTYAGARAASWALQVAGQVRYAQSVEEAALM